MKAIPLSRGLVAVVDDDDHDRLAAFRWHATVKRDGSVGYACRGGGRSAVYMHRVVVDAPDGYEVDHVDGDGLNNRRSNLRLATHSENLMNQRLSRANTSGFRGVFYDRSRGRWRAEICVNGRKINLGRHDTAEAASIAYAEASEKYHGSFGRASTQEQRIRDGALLEAVR